MNDVQLMQWLWLTLTIAGVALGGYLLMKFFRYEVKHLAQRAVKSEVLDQVTLDWIEEISHGVRLAMLALVALLMVFFTLRVMGHPSVQGWNLARLLEWLMARGVRPSFGLRGDLISPTAGLNTFKTKELWDSGISQDEDTTSFRMDCQV